MSPKQITKLATILAAVSISGSAVMIVARPEWGLLSWWPVLGFALSLLLFLIAYFKGAYLAAQERAQMVEMLSDCYLGTTEQNNNLELETRR